MSTTLNGDDEVRQGIAIDTVRDAAAVAASTTGGVNTTTFRNRSSFTQHQQQHVRSWRIRRAYVISSMGKTQALKSRPAGPNGSPIKRRQQVWLRPRTAASDEVKVKLTSLQTSKL